MRGLYDFTGTKAAINQFFQNQRQDRLLADERDFQREKLQEQRRYNQELQDQQFKKSLGVKAASQGAYTGQDADILEYNNMINAKKQQLIQEKEEKDLADRTIKSLNNFRSQGLDFSGFDDEKVYENRAKIHGLNKSIETSVAEANDIITRLKEDKPTMSVKELMDVKNKYVQSRIQGPIQELVMAFSGGKNLLGDPEAKKNAEHAATKVMDQVLGAYKSTPFYNYIVKRSIEEGDPSKADKYLSKTLSSIDHGAINDTKSLIGDDFSDTQIGNFNLEAGANRAISLAARMRRDSGGTLDFSRGQIKDLTLEQMKLVKDYHMDIETLNSIEVNTNENGQKVIDIEIAKEDAMATKAAIERLAEANKIGLFNSWTTWIGKNLNLYDTKSQEDLAQLGKSFLIAFKIGGANLTSPERNAMIGTIIATETNDKRRAEAIQNNLIKSFNRELKIYEKAAQKNVSYEDIHRTQEKLDKRLQEDLKATAIDHFGRSVNDHWVDSRVKNGILQELFDSKKDPTREQASSGPLMHQGVDLSEHMDRATFDKLSKENPEKLSRFVKHLNSKKKATK